MIRRRLLAVAAVLAVLVVVDGVGDRTRRLVDLTATKSLTLSPQTKDVLGHVHRRVRVTAVLDRRDPGRAPAAALLERYRRTNRRLSFRIVDPSDAAGEVRRLGVDPVLGGVAVSSGGRTELAATATEQDITAAVARLVRGRSPLACFTTGHGELDVTATTDDGLTALGEAMVRNGYRLDQVDLLTATTVPAGCDVLVVARPTAPLGAAEAVVGRWLADGGSALVLTDPESTADVSGVVGHYGLAVERGIVFEGDDQLRFPGDPTRPIVLRYRSPSPIARRLPPTFFPAAQAVTVAPDGEQRDGLTAVSVATTSPRSFLEREPATPSFDPAVDVQGPVTVVAAADRSMNSGGRVRRTRLVVTGDADFATNAFVGQAGNTTLVLRSLDWLTLDEDLVTVAANLPTFRVLELTSARLRYARLLAVVVLPGLFLLGGAMVWAARRTR